jgi:glycosyltransferase involved in cell wall biosynthesis
VLSEQGPGKSRIAILMPCRDAAAWVEQMLDSIAAQTRLPDEVLVVDDGSTDGSADVVRRWAAEHGGSPTVRVVGQSPQGVAAAIRRGMAETSSELVARVDADDMLEPHFLEALEQALVAHPSAGYAYPAMRMFGTASGRYPVREFDPVALVIGGNFVTSAALMRREAYDTAGGVDDLPAWEDWDLWLRFLEAGWPGVFVDQDLYLWRRHERSRNTMSLGTRRALRLRIWWRHRGLVARYAVRGLPYAVGRVVHPVRQQ